MRVSPGPGGRASIAGVLVMMLVVLAGCAGFVRGADGAGENVALAVAGDIQQVHDPSAVIREGDKYYFFTTGVDIPMHCSSDFATWRDCGTVFSIMPQWAHLEIPGANDMWAPDISYFSGTYHLYYAVSIFGTNMSVIGLATNATLDPSSPRYSWVDEGLVIESHAGDDWNAIDPSVVLDESGRPWLAFGSYWRGIQLVRLDPATGKPENGAKLEHIAERLEAPDALEAPYIVHRDGYYYLFASYDFCCRGADSTYNIRVGRSRSITGPYADAKGTPMLLGGGTLIAESGARWKGPGGESVFRTADGKWWIIYHTYDAKQDGVPTLAIHRLVWDSSGWPLPVAVPNDE